MPATHTATRRDVCVIVTGEDCNGTPVHRVLPSGYEVALRDKTTKRADIHGPHATMCRECGELMFTDTPSGAILALQSHYRTTHSYTPALLP